MANRFWVPGGNGSWASTTNWSASSGGASGASVPGTGDDVFFDVNSGSSAYTVNVDSSGQTCRDFTVTSDAATYMTFAGTWGFSVRGNFTLSSGMGWTFGSTLTFTQSGTTSLDIDTQGVTLTCNVTISPTNNASVYSLASGLTLGSSNNLSLLRGIINLTPYSVTAGRVNMSGTSSRQIVFDSSTITTQAVGSGSSAPWNLTGSNYTINSYQSTITLTSSSSSTTSEFVGGSADYWNVNVSTTGSGQCHIKGSNNFMNKLTINPGRTVDFEAGTTNTIAYPVFSGTVGNLVTISSITAAEHYLVKGIPDPLGDDPGPILSFDYMNISYSNVAETNTWYAGANSTDSGNNTNWIFTAPPSGPAYDSIDGVPASGIAEFDRVVWSDISTIK